MYKDGEMEGPWVFFNDDGTKYKWGSGTYRNGKPLPSDFSRGSDAYTAGNYAEVIDWFRKAADQGDAEAQNNIGMIYIEDEDALENSDIVTAYMWTYITSTNGNSQAKENSRMLSPILPEPIVEKAKERAHLCMANNYVKSYCD